MSKIIDSFHIKGQHGNGLPLGNLTSQLLVNVYLNGFDNFVKRQLNIKYYVRYADDFLILPKDNYYLKKILQRICEFLPRQLNLLLNQDKVFIQTLSSGVDFLGWVHFSQHRALRAATKCRMWRRLKFQPIEAAINSYLGLLSHGNAYKLTRVVSSWNKL